METKVKGFDNVEEIRLLALSKWYKVTDKEALKNEYERYSDADNFDEVYAAVAYKMTDALVRIVLDPATANVYIIDNVTTCFADTEDEAFNEEVETLYNTYE